MLASNHAMHAIPRNALQGNAMHSIEIISGLTFEQLRAEVEKTRMRRLPPRTLQHWLSKLGIERDIHGQFSEEDAEIIKALIRWLRHPAHTIDQFANQLKEMYSHAS
jgi:hypothetical protein